MNLNELLSTEEIHEKNFFDSFKKAWEALKNKNKFFGWIKKLEMIQESPENKILEKENFESKDVELTVKDVIKDLFTSWFHFEDVQFQKNSMIQKASADLFIGDKIIKKMPLTELIALEKRLIEIRKVVEQAPILDASYEWTKSIARNDVWIISQPKITTKTERIQYPFVLYEATENHPAQIDVIGKDEIVGSYTTVSFSGTITGIQKKDLIKKIDDLIIEVKKSKIKATETSISDVQISVLLNDYFFGESK